MLELQSAVDNHINRQPVFLLHDVSWPWAFRDIYYDVGRTEKPHANVNRGALVIEHEKLAESGFLILEDFSVASKSGGDKNGVLRSVEDFQKIRSTSLDFLENTFFIRPRNFVSRRWSQ